jgi:hypothetical protein
MLGYNVRWDPCHHRMAPPQVAGGGDGLQTCRVDANIMNKHSRTADKGWSSSLGLGAELKTAHRKKKACYEVTQRASDLDGCSG